MMILLKTHALRTIHVFVLSLLLDNFFSPCEVFSEQIDSVSKYGKHFPPYFYRCVNGLTLVSRLKIEDQSDGTETVSVYPYPLKERSETLYRNSGKTYLVNHVKEYACQPINISNDPSLAGMRGIPDPDALRDYLKKFDPVRLSCSGGSAGNFVELWDSGFREGGYTHGLIVVDGFEQFGLWYRTAFSGNFNFGGKYFYDYWTTNRFPPAPVPPSFRYQTRRVLVKDMDRENSSECQIVSHL